PVRQPERLRPEASLDDEEDRSLVHLRPALGALGWDGVGGQVHPAGLPPLAPGPERMAADEVVGHPLCHPALGAQRPEAGVRSWVGYSSASAFVHAAVDPVAVPPAVEGTPAPSE